MKTTIAGWKLPIIRWSFRQIAPLLPVLEDATYETLARCGIDDLHKNNLTGEIALYPSSEKYVPEPTN